jgi:hypothetical protein
MERSAIIRICFLILLVIFMKNLETKRCWNCGAVVYRYALKTHQKFCFARGDDTFTSKEILSSLESEIPHAQINKCHLTTNGLLLNSIPGQLDAWEMSI